MTAVHYKMMSSTTTTSLPNYKIIRPLHYSNIKIKVFEHPAKHPQYCCFNDVGVTCCQEIFLAEN